MSGSQPAPNPDDPQHGGPRAEGDPSMEDILASIRRILSEEENAEASGERGDDPKEDVVPAAEPEDEDVLVLDTSMMVAEAPQPEATAPPAPEPPAPALSPMPAVAVAPPLPQVPPQPPPQAEPAPVPASLLAPEAAAAAFTAMSDLVRTLAAERATQVHRGGPTIEDLVREEIRPLLKTWLDTNLPPIVERLVRAELERVVNRAVP